MKAKLRILLFLLGASILAPSIASACDSCVRYQEITRLLKSSSVQEQESGVEQTSIVLRDLREQRNRELRNEEMVDFLKLMAWGIKAAQGDTYIFEQYGFFKDKFKREFERLLKMPGAFTAEELKQLNKKAQPADA